MLRAIHRKRITVIALFAVLFSALSPAFAALKYRGQPEVLAQICSIHGLERAASNDQTPPNGPPVSHQIHCAWCSASAAQPGIDGSSVRIVVPTPVTQTQPAVIIETAPAFFAPVASYHSQAPPVLA